MKAPCLDCKDRHEACHGICDKYKAWREWKDCVKQNELAVKNLEGNVGAVKMHGMKCVGKQIYQR